MKNKKVLILFGSNAETMQSDYFMQKLRAAVENELESKDSVICSNLNRLVYDARNFGSRISHASEHWDLADFDLVIFRRVGHEVELAIAAVQYLKAKNISFADEYLNTLGRGKLSAAFMRAVHNLPIPRTIYASPDILLNIFSARPPFELPFILKANVGKRGKDNHLITSIEHMHEVLESSVTSLIAQPLVENDGDYRILILNGKPRLIMFRRGIEGSHLNNTSQGADARIVEQNSIDKNIIRDAISAAGLEKLTVAGVDMLIDKKTQKHVILEVNRAPQIEDGAFSEKKLEVYGLMVDELLKIQDKGLDK